MENIDDLPPWDCIDPALTAERMMAIAMIVRDETDAKIAARDYRDINWNAGCDCYGWVVSRMHRSGTSARDKRTERGEYADWLLLDSVPFDLDLSFRIGGKDGVPAKFYRWDVNKTDDSLSQTNDELLSIQASLPNLASKPDPVVKFAVDKDRNGRVTSVRLAQFDVDGNLIYTWMIWSADEAVIPIDDAPKPEGVELEEPPVTLPEDEEQAEDEDDKDKQEGA